MSEKYQSVLIFGPPGCGKGTQGRILGSIPGFQHVATGDVFRRLDIHTELGQTVFEHLSEGNLVPDDLTIEIWKNFMDGQIASHNYNPRSDLLVLDGLPRNVEQVSLIEKYVNPLKIIHLYIEDEDELQQRIRHRAMKENRIDDAQAGVFSHRWNVYQNITKPVLSQYPEDKIALITADRSPAEVAMQILGTLIPVQLSHFNKLKKEQAERRAARKAAKEAGDSGILN